MEALEHFTKLVLVWYRSFITFFSKVTLVSFISKVVCLISKVVCLKVIDVISSLALLWESLDESNNKLTLALMKGIPLQN